MSLLRLVLLLHILVQSANAQNRQHFDTLQPLVMDVGRHACQRIMHHRLTIIRAKGKEAPTYMGVGLPCAAFVGDSSALVRTVTELFGEDNTLELDSEVVCKEVDHLIAVYLGNPLVEEVVRRFHIPEFCAAIFSEPTPESKKRGIQDMYWPEMNHWLKEKLKKPKPKSKDEL